jgi:hypothetical protein
MQSDHNRSELAVSEIVSVTEFKARCLEILGRIGSRDRPRGYHQAREGNGVLTSPEAQPEMVQPDMVQPDMVKQIWGFMRGSVVVPAEVDLTESVWDEPRMCASFAAERS